MTKSDAGDAVRPGASDQIILEGLVSVRAALEGGSRALSSLHLRSDLERGDLTRVLALAEKRGVPVRRENAEFFARRAGGASHGGVLAFAGPRSYRSLDDLVPAQGNPFIAMLDGLEDPFNFGQAVRVLYAAGADGLVIRPRDWGAAEGIVTRASAGAFERMPIALADSSLEAAAQLRERGLTVVCTAGDRIAAPTYRADLTGPLFLVIGGEKRGISRAMLDAADLLVRIPYGRAFDQSLGLVGATSALAFEVLRQRAAALPGNRQ